MISEQKMVHKLWNILEEKGYKVSGEVKVVQNEKYSEIRNSKSKLEKKGGVSTTIDTLI